MKNPLVQKITHCRACKKAGLRLIKSLGPHPNANTYVKAENIEKEELYFPLDVYLCEKCSYLQLGHSIDFHYLFEDYVYVSSTSKIFVDHFKEYAKTVYSSYGLSLSSLVVDIGSNDGALLSFFKKEGANILGVEPNKDISKYAISQNIPTIGDYFNIKTANSIKKKFGHATVITANNTFAQISDSDSFLNGVTELLSSDGILVIEVPYVIDMLKKGYFDLIYHEHHAFPSIKGLQALFKRFDMEIINVEQKNIHGGSIRVYAKKSKSHHKIQKNVSYYLSLENEMELKKASTYLNFFEKVDKNRVALLKMLLKLSCDGHKIIGYGAPAKANTILNYFNIGKDLIHFIVDDSHWKQGRFTPGKRIPIVNKNYMTSHKSEYMLILAWNFAESIIAKNENFRKNGGTFIIPFPHPKLIK